MFAEKICDFILIILLKTFLVIISSSVMDPNAVLASFCRIRIGISIQGLPSRIRFWSWIRIRICINFNVKIIYILFTRISQYFVQNSEKIETYETDETDKLALLWLKVLNNSEFLT